jgi:hypothetical protein
VIQRRQQHGLRVNHYLRGAIGVEAGNAYKERLKLRLTPGEPIGHVIDVADLLFRLPTPRTAAISAASRSPARCCGERGRV